MKKLMTAASLPDYNIGRWTYGVPEVLYPASGKTLTIGSFCSISDGVKILLGGEHRTDWITTYPFNVVWERERDIKNLQTSKGDVIIGSDVWLGLDSVIMSGVTIGHGAVVGCGAVVCQNVPPYAVVFGNPATIIRYRFPTQTIDSLLKIAWWEWSDKRIKSFLPELLNGDVETFIRKCNA